MTAVLFALWFMGSFVLAIAGRSMIETRGTVGQLGGLAGMLAAIVSLIVWMFAVASVVMSHA